MSNSVLRRLRERREAERKAEEEAKRTHQTVQNSATLLDAVAQEKKLREAEERRIAQEAREDMAKRSAYELEHDHAYAHNAKQKELEREAERRAKESLRNFTVDGSSFEQEKRDQLRQMQEELRQKELESKNLHATTSYSVEYDHAYNHAQKLREGELKAERDAKQTLRHFAGGKTLLDEKLEQRKREEEAERQRVLAAKESISKNNYSDPEFDRGYVRAKQLAQEEKEAEVKAKASLLQYSQQDVSHEMVMKNGVRIRKDSAQGSQSPPTGPCKCICNLHLTMIQSFDQRRILCAHSATSYPFTDPARRIKAPSPAAVKALERFQQNLGKDSARRQRHLLPSSNLTCHCTFLQLKTARKRSAKPQSNPLARARLTVVVGMAPLDLHERPRLSPSNRCTQTARPRLKVRHFIASVIPGALLVVILIACMVNGAQIST